MSVHRRQYQPYAGDLTPERSRFLVVPRYAVSGLFGSRLLMGFFFIALLPVLVELALVYLAHNPIARGLIGLADLDKLLQIDGRFFRQVLSTQCFFGVLLTAWVGPGLIAADLANGALPLYLCRPFSRVEYVLGKATVLVLLLSSITWVPGILLYLVNALLAEDGWGLAHLRIPFALLVGGLCWIAVMVLFVLSLSAWIRWRLAATALLFGLFFVSAGLGEALAVVLQVSWGRVFNVGHVFEIIWAQLFATPRHDHGVPLVAAWLALIGLCAFSFLVLGQRLRARERVG